MSIKWWLLAALVVAGCGNVCTRNSDCPNGLICGGEAVCEPPPVDAAVDAGDEDAGRPDGGSISDGDAAIDGSGFADAAEPGDAAGPPDGGGGD